MNVCICVFSVLLLYNIVVYHRIFRGSFMPLSFLSSHWHSATYLFLGLQKMEIECIARAYRCTIYVLVIPVNFKSFGVDCLLCNKLSSWVSPKRVGFALARYARICGVRKRIKVWRWEKKMGRFNELQLQENQGTQAHPMKY